MNGIELSNALKNGSRVYGTLVTSPSPIMPEWLKSIDLDYVFIDTEHIPIGRHMLSWMCQVYKAINLAPIVRIPRPDPYEACKVLDGGASGIVAPYVETVEEVKALTGAVKFRPLKGRKLAEVLDRSCELEASLAAYIRKRNQGRSLVINIESVPAIENLGNLLEVPGVDAVLIGPHDLSVSLGIPEEYSHPKFDKAVRTIIETARAKGVGAGIHCWGNIEQNIDWVRHGANMVLRHADVTIFAEALQKEVGHIRKTLGDQTGQSASGDAEAI
ncbi:MAG: HpcH/HpaI aldolase family protein [Planctomycetota bacterium]|jgi:4-hydroxy-2-oxoheptanedioate aldolase